MITFIIQEPKQPSAMCYEASTSVVLIKFYQLSSPISNQERADWRGMAQVFKT